MCVRVCACVRMRVCAYVCVFVCAYVCVRVCVYRLYTDYVFRLYTYTYTNTVRGVGRGVSLGSGNPLQVQYITQLGEVTPVILQMV